MLFIPHDIRHHMPNPEPFSLSLPDFHCNFILCYQILAITSQKPLVSSQTNQRAL